MIYENRRDMKVEDDQKTDFMGNMNRLYHLFQCQVLPMIAASPVGGHRVSMIAKSLDSGAYLGFRNGLFIRER